MDIREGLTLELDILIVSDSKSFNLYFMKKGIRLEKNYNKRVDASSSFYIHVLCVSQGHT